MHSTAKPLDMKYMRGTLGDEPMNIGNNNGPQLRGVEQNTARGVTMPMQLLNIIKLEHALAMDAPPVDYFDTYEDEN